MRILTRLTATLGAGTDRAVARFENHDAIAAAAVRGAREAVATARVRHARLHRDGEGRRHALAELLAAERSWGERARRAAATSESEALACLERRRLVRTRIEDARTAVAAHEGLERECGERLAELESRLADIGRRRDTLRSRESIARAGEVLDSLSRDGGDGLEDVFDRWEVRIAGSEAHESARDALDAQADTDALERRYANAERDEALQGELAALLATSADEPSSVGANVSVRADLAGESRHD